jgi:hypothetical protein
MGALTLIYALAAYPSVANDTQKPDCSPAAGRQVSPCAPRSASTALRLRWLDVKPIANPIDPRVALQSLFSGMPAGPQKDAFMRNALSSAQGNADPQSTVADGIQLAISMARAGRFTDAATYLQQALKTSRDSESARLSAPGNRATSSRPDNSRSTNRMSSNGA